MIDIHSHVVFGVDDGAESLEQAVAMCRAAADDGCRAMVATPHVHHPFWPDQDLRVVRERLAQLREALGLQIRVLGGAEVRVDSSFFEVLDRLNGVDADLRLAGSAYVLLELDPQGLGPDPRACVHEALLSGWRPVIAHPEVYGWLCDDEPLVRSMVERGAALQITAASVLGWYGRATRARARRLLDLDLVHFVASDCHDLQHRPPGLDAARLAIAKRYGDARAHRLFSQNPQAILDDRKLEEAA